MTLVNMTLVNPTAALLSRLHAMTQLTKAALSPSSATSCETHSTRTARVSRWVAIASLLLLAACMPTRQAPPGVEFVIVRHAEKRSDDPRDPQLTDAGLARAQRLAAALSSQPLAAVYATAYRRTQQTAAPSAAAHGLAVTTYDAKQDAREFAASLKQTHGSGTILVVGHSNTVPDIAAALCACVVAPIQDNEFDRRVSVRIDGEGQATLSDTHLP